MTKKSRRVAKARRVLLSLSLVLVTMLVAVGGTIAWLTDTTGPVVNTFTPTNIDIELKETVDSSFEMVPGKVHPKDPTVTVKASSEKSWVFVAIEQVSASYVKDDGTHYVPITAYLDCEVATQENGWTLLNTIPDDATKGGTKVYYRVVETSESDQSFAVLKDNQVTIKSSLTKDAMDKLQTAGATNPKLNFTAYAIQYEGFEPEVTEGATEATAEQIKAAAEKAWAEINK